MRSRSRGEDGDGVWEGERDPVRRARPRWGRRSVAGVTRAVTEEADGSATAFLLPLIRRLLVGAEQHPVGAQQPPFFPSSARRKMGLLPFLAFFSAGLAALSFDFLLRDSHRLRLDRSGPCGRSSASCLSCR